MVEPLDEVIERTRRLSALRDTLVKVFAILAVATVSLFLIGMVLFSQPESWEGLKAVKEAGYWRPELVESGYLKSQCDLDDSYFLVRAENDRGKKVPLTVCCGLLKGCAIRP